MRERLAGEIIDALDQLTVTAVGTNPVTIVLPQRARILEDIRESLDTVFANVQTLVEAHPLHPVLTSLLAVGLRTAARIPTQIVGKDFASAGRLTSYAGLAPLIWRSGSFRGDHPARKGKRFLKGTLFLSALPQ